ncbi:hypothetical protein GCM10007198_29070 [Microbacterium aerolatum]|uniref:Uncharacterized protein n=1 Tax=Microbacterium aerolatum TaxID=153731 RepID=A0A511A9H2_9MICO|nr:hypothetical protein MAE01_00260 [Microbacterium aerolatum]GGB36698.1 hypothetical protein GCM10007198_29070 [Microbacterium aerolatum]
MRVVVFFVAGLDGRATTAFTAADFVEAAFFDALAPGASAGSSAWSSKDAVTVLRYQREWTFSWARATIGTGWHTGFLDLWIPCVPDHEMATSRAYPEASQGAWLP